MNKTQALVKRWAAKLFPSEADQIWRKWVDFKERNSRDLVELLKDNEVQDGFKARALFILLSPDLTRCPFYWVDHDHERSYPKFGVKFKFADLSTDVLLYAAELVEEFCQYLNRERPANYASIMDTYNSYLIELLASLPEAKAENVFQLFEINDISAWWNMDDASGYNPLRRLFMHPGVSEQWKKKADSRMRQVIRNEVAGETQARAEHENALKCYASMIQLQLYSNNLHYSTELFVDQIRFIVEVKLKPWLDRPVFEMWHLARIFKIIATKGNEDLLYALSRYVLTTKGEPFEVYNAETLEAAELMLGVLKNDPELSKTLEGVILSGRHEIAENSKKQQARKEEEKATLQGMKLSS